MGRIARLFWCFQVRMRMSKSMTMIYPANSKLDFIGGKSEGFRNEDIY
jgi:hypothetical protein